MLFKKLFLIYGLINTTVLPSALSNQFAYPVAQFKNEIFYIHQKTLNDLILCKWDIDKNTVENDLLPNCFPGNLTLLPNKIGFSFIDQGKIRIKNFNSEKIITINLSEPVYNISTINWMDDLQCYFSAKRGKRFCIFFVNIETDQLFYINQNSPDKKMGSDLLYPQKINSDLFFIERSVDERYRTKKSHYKIVKIRHSNNASSKVQLLTESDKTTIVDFANVPISFLTMTSENEGFFIEHASLIEKTDQIISLAFHRLYLDKQKNNYQTKELFSFNIPVKYVFGKNTERLYESVLPFLPKIYGNKIHYSHCSNEEKLILDLYVYDFKNNKTEKETFAINNEIFFSPILIGDKILYGSNLIEKTYRLNKLNALNFLKCD